MTSVNIEAIRNLETFHNSSCYIESVSILIKILDNIIREPCNEKYRTIRLENKIIKEKLLCLAGMRELLNHIGFVEINGTLNLSSSILMAKIKKYRDYLADRHVAVSSGQSDSKNKSLIDNHGAGPSSSVVKSTAVKKQTKKIIPLKSFLERTRFEKIVPFTSEFLQQLEVLSDQVQQYEDDRLQYYGRKIIPLATLTENAINNMRQVQKQQGKHSTCGEAIKDPCLRDWILVELTKWFNEKFFTWVNTIPCKICGKDDSRSKSTLIENDVRVELLMCCNTSTKFCRYNDIVELLKTRKGRCGEYANCFTFLCRCLDYDARLVHANFDHVWTEVFSVAQKRWIHVDPSDNVVDAPLMYEHGWKRDINYIIAYSRDDVQDVTWRYSSNHNQLISKRGNCPEEDLLKTILLLRKKRQENCSAIRKKYLKRRALMELIELMTPRQPTENEKRGRSSGSLSWKLSRGEDQDCMNNFSVFTPLEQEVDAKQFNLRYSSCNDTYERFIYDKSNGSITTINKCNKWQSCTHRWENIYRKEERDWKMVYLARVEDTDHAEIEWKFDFSKIRAKITSISLKLNTKIYENGQISIKILHNGEELPNIDCVQQRNLHSFIIRVLLTGGSGDCAWQHTQLFRQSIVAKEEYPLELNILFE